MADIDNLILEHLKRIQAEQSATRERDAQIITRLANIESGLARIAREEAQTYGELIQDRHAVDKIKERLDRIEKRLDIAE